ncbi:unnamed protein product [Litomosoides sigmodontis]|uniref:DNA polymerase delta subunit 3 n=1 Tax=Litomosoides sigmodontis TaxID=42156 RepID=A0A3P6V8A3_LITSI|nr:unnamed protein product [Litomosoides sigmodontis]
MGLDKRRILETSLFDLEQIVTVQYLSRHANLPIDDAKDELAEFLKHNKKKTRLHVVYVISGELNVSDPTASSSDSSSAGNGTATHKLCRTQLVRDCHLEQVRQTYRKVETCEIYGLHTKPIKSLCLLYSVDSLEDAEYERTDPERSWLSHPETEVMRKEMMAHHNATSVSGNQKKRPQKDIFVSTSKFPEPTTKRKKNNVTSLFSQTASRNKEETPSMKSGSQRGQRNLDKKANVMSGEAVQRRGNRIVIDSKQQDIKEETGSAEKSTEKITLETRNVVKMGNALLTEDDLFSDGDSNPDEMDCEESKKDKIAEVDEKISRLSGNNSSKTEDSCGSQRKATRKEYAIETFLDADGFMITKQVLKEVEIEPSPANSSTETRGKTRNAKLLDNKEGKSTKAPQGQAKISSFFQKK